MLKSCLGEQAYQVMTGEDEPDWQLKIIDRRLWSCWSCSGL